MNKRWLQLVIPVLLGLILPGVAMFLISGNNSNVAFTTSSTYAPTESLNKDTCDVPMIEIPVLMSNSVVMKMPLEDYIIGVVLAEMPAAFEAEALKAQAVVARTYTLRRIEGNVKHPDAVVCTDPSCCQGYCDVSAYRQKGGDDSDILKIENAVSSTEGIVLMYNDKLIEATYFSCSGGSTEDAKAVWGEEIPYLQATESPGEEGAKYFTHTQCYSLQEFQTLLSRKLKENPTSWIGKVTYTNGNGVESIDIDGQVYSGTEIRRLLSLRSTSFKIAVFGDVVTVTTRGFGHRVGMSQYGADAMAVQGSDYAEILSHYYKGAELFMYKS